MCEDSRRADPMSSTAVDVATDRHAERRPGGLSRPPVQREVSAFDQFEDSVRTLLATVLDRAFGLALDQVEGLARTFDDIALRGGPKLNAMLGGARAALEGNNVVWGAIRGAVSALSPTAKAALVTVLVLAFLLLPVTVVLLLVLIVAAAVAAARAGSGTG